MTAAEMVRRRRADWDELERLVSAVAGGGHRRAPAALLSRFSSLMRATCADLARARALGLPDDLVDYLNGLAARAHNVYYVAPRVRWSRIGAFFTTAFPLTIDRNRLYVSIGLALFFLPFGAMLALASVDHEALYSVVPRAQLQAAERMYEGDRDEGRSESDDAKMTGFYVNHNVGIAFQCFATGVFVGLGSLFALVFNGVMLGAIIGFVAGTPSGGNIVSFVIGHGPFELTAIALAGAAGIRLGFGVIITGAASRLVSLRRAGADAIRIVIGAAALLVGAAFIEGFFSPSGLPFFVKATFSALCVIFLIWYLGVYPRQVAGREAAG